MLDEALHRHHVSAKVTGPPGEVFVADPTVFTTAGAG